jgi:hypothetical protein
MLCLFTHFQSFPKYCQNQIVVSITSCPKRSDTKSAIHENVINFIVSLSIRKCPSKFMNVRMGTLYS